MREFVPTLLRDRGTRQGRRSSLAVLAAVALGTGLTAPSATAKKKKSCKKIKKKAFEEADLRCQVQRPTCEVALSAICEPGPDVQECLDATSECCAFLEECDAQAAIACIVRAFLTAPPP
jgi:hypothetical protein